MALSAAKRACHPRRDAVVGVGPASVRSARLPSTVRLLVWPARRGRRRRPYTQHIRLAAIQPARPEILRSLVQAGPRL